MTAATLTTSSLRAKSDYVMENLKKTSGTALALSHRYEKLLLTEKYYDCVFLLEGDEVRGHKLILATASPVFEAMFYGLMSEKQNVIEILDMSCDVFKLLMLYIYRGNVDFRNISLEETIELYYGAEKYLLNDLKLDCLEAIQMKLRFSNILAALELSICLDLSSLLKICFNFFTRCCLNEPQFAAHLKAHYYHVSKDCIKSIINLCKEQIPAQHLLWFIYEWCQQECLEMGLKQSDCSSIIEDLNLKECNSLIDNKGASLQKPQYYQAIERCYYKACRPFTIDYDNCEWSTYVKSNRFISLQGLTLNSRLTPHLTRMSIPTDYMENFNIEITAPDYDVSLLWTLPISKQLTKYNCDLNVKWAQGLVLSPDVEYQIKLVWHPSQTQGAEYPCSLLSSKVEGIQFRDLDTHSGSLIKGIHFINLV